MTKQPIADLHYASRGAGQMRTLLGLLLVTLWSCVGNLVCAEERFFESSGGRLRYLLEGEGEPVLLLHGFAEDSETGWERSGVIDELTKVQFKIVAVDLLGHGGSARSHDLKDYGVSMANEVIALMDALKLSQVHGVGYSMGAALMSKLLELHPDRFLSATLSGYGEPPLPNDVNDELVQEIRKNLNRMNLLEGNDPRALANLSVGWREWRVAKSSLQRNQIPVLALIGAEDIFLPDTRRLVQSLATSRLLVIPGDHGSARSRPEYYSALVDFLNQHRDPDVDDRAAKKEGVE